ncbi:hypothetical protein COO91_09034 [Nostoc flagelliforme CCNUN1]|uniref:Uncharacterized protein n=1 Tax=Nostoc flagelliforme CCNUN1 TaxID=2038116 RepID=A0A2K8T741_9NOSO|nr:hypothetical protein COO91_09034 [Nostoc flagelliforme CCNUN1]
MLSSNKILFLNNLTLWVLSHDLGSFVPHKFVGQDDLLKAAKTVIAKMM